MVERGGRYDAMVERGGRHDAMVGRGRETRCYGGKGEGDTMLWWEGGGRHDDITAMVSVAYM